jgi:hypothetical protein
MTREELLERLYHAYWHETGTLEADVDGYSFISHADLDRLDEICQQIEAIDIARLAGE